MATAETNHRHDGPQPVGGYHEAEKLLKLAEDLQARCEATERRIAVLWLVSAAAILLAFVTVSSVLTSPTAQDLLQRAAPWYVLVAVLYIIGACYYVWEIMRSLRRKLATDRRALYEVVGLLREVESAVAARDQRSALERAEFRIRLSRFDIGPEHHNSRRR